jgi:hypothetical protein
VLQLRQVPFRLQRLPGRLTFCLLDSKDLFGGSSSAASRPMGTCLEAKPKSGLVLDGRQPPMASRAYRAGLATSCCIWIF